MSKKKVNGFGNDSALMSLVRERERATLWEIGGGLNWDKLTYQPGLVVER